MAAGQTAPATDAAQHAKQDIRRAREFYKYLQPDNLIDPRLRRRSSTFDFQIDHVPSLSDALVPYCQLTALRCDVQKAMLNVMDRDAMYFLAEASRPPSDDPDNTGFREFIEDPILRSCTSSAIKGRICEMTVRMTEKPADFRTPVFAVHDLVDSSFAHLPVVSGPPYYRFYAGVPITTRGGIHIGSLAVMDTKPRPSGLSEAEEDFLGRTAAQVMTYLEINRQALEGRRARLLAQGLECFIAGKRSLSEEIDAITSDKASKRRSKPGYGLPVEEHGVPDENGTPQSKDPISRVHKNSPDSEGSDTSASETTLANEKLRAVEAESRSHSKTFSRAANLLREAFGDLGEDGNVIFFNLKNRLNSRSQVNRQQTVSRAPSQSQPPTPTTRTAFQSQSDELASVLASSSSTENFEFEDGQPELVVDLKDETLREMIKRYPGGRLWSFDDIAARSSSDEDQNCRGSEVQRRTSRRVKSEECELKVAFPQARQLLFAPIWDSNTGSFAHALFICTALESRSFSATTELPFLNSFCSTIMAECSRLDAMKADKQKSDFVGTISHEMRSPLHGILASVEFLADTELTTFQQSLIDTIGSCTRTATDTVQHVLDFSKINSFQRHWQASNKRNSRFGRKRHYLGPENTSKAYQHGAPPLLQLFGVTDVLAVTEEVIEGLCVAQNFSSGVDMTDLSREARGRGRDTIDGIMQPERVQMILDVEKADWTFVTQPGAVRRIILNLTGNALKYTQAGTVIVKLELKKDQSEAEEKAVMILTVKDTGCGISEDFLDSKLFVPFAQENALAPGTGLGLSIVQGITVMLGGTIEVESQVGKGTTIQVALPLVRPLPGQTSTLTTPHSSGTSHSSNSNGDDSIVSLQNQSPHCKVCFYQPRKSSCDDTLHQVVANYVRKWYGLEFIGREILATADVIITDEEDLDGLTKEMVGTPGSRPALIVLCNVSSRHSASYTTRLEKQIHGVVEFVAKPAGPYKLARSIRLALQKVKANQRRFSRLGSLSIIAEQSSPETATPGGDSEIKNLTEGLGQIDFSLGASNDTAQVVQATEFFAVSQTSQNAQMAITTPMRRTKTPLPMAEDSSFPFPSQNESVSTQDFDVPTAPNGAVVSTKQSLEIDTKARPRRTSSLKQPLSNIIMGNPKVLLVDDNKINLKLLETFLKNKRRYHRLDMAEDGQQAVDAFTAAAADEPYEIIFMDVSMPVMNGFEATRAIRTLEDELGFKANGAMIIALTGLASGSDQAEGFEAGVDIYLTKPVSFKEVGKMLDNWEAHQIIKAEIPVENGDESIPHGALTGEV